MKRFVLLLGVFCLAAAGPRLKAVPQADAETRVPVLLELFTSEGCSSCPPADELLTSLDRSQPIAGANLIVISEHVDYWNRLGWIDPNSSRLFSDRQSEYAARLHTNDVYTPQLLIDGRYALVGGDKVGIERAIRIAKRSQKAPLTLNAKSDGGSAVVHIAIGATSDNRPVDVYAVLATDRVSSKVTAGENSGRELVHTSVASSFQKVGTLQGQPFETAAHVPLRDKGPVRVIVFAQNRTTGQIIAAAQQAL